MARGARRLKAGYLMDRLQAGQMTEGQGARSLQAKEWASRLDRWLLCAALMAKDALPSQNRGGLV